MEERNDKVQELDPEQMEKVTGGTEGGFACICRLCNESFPDIQAYTKHIQEKHKPRSLSVIDR